MTGFFFYSLKNLKNFTISFSAAQKFSKNFKFKFQEVVPVNELFDNEHVQTHRHEPRRNIT